MTQSMQETTHPLNRAATLHHIATDRFKVARLSFVTVRPADGEASPMATLLYGILRRGSEKYPRLSLFNRRLDELYGTTLTIRNYLHGDNHVISFTAEMPEDRYLPPHGEGESLVGGVMELLSQLILHPLTDSDGCLRREAVAAEKQALCDSIRAQINDPRTYAADRFRRIMCPDEPYGISIGGTVEGVEALTPEAVSDHRRAHMEAARCEVFYVGRTPAAEILSLWQTYFGAWDPRPLPALPSGAHPLPGAVRRVSESLPISQGKLCMGFSCGESEATLAPHETAAMMLLNEMLGAMPSSRLFRHVRETLGLCYYCESALDLTKGILWVSAGIRNDKREAAEAAVGKVWQSFLDGEIDGGELMLSKRTLISSYRQTEDSQGAMETFFARPVLAGVSRRARDMADCISDISAVTAADVAAAARRFCLDTVYFLEGTASGEGDGDDNA